MLSSTHRFSGVPGRPGCALVLVLIFCCAAEAFGLQAAMTIHLDHLRLRAVRADRVELIGECTLLPDVTADVHDLVFSDVHLDATIPVFVQRLPDSLTLRKGERRPLPPLALTVYLSDLPSFQPLDDLLSAGTARLTGEVRAELTLSAVDRLLLHDAHPTALLLLDQQVPFSRESIDSRIAPSVSAMNFGQKVVRSTGSLVSDLLGGIVSVDVNESAGTRCLLRIRTDYRIRAASGEEETFETDRLGFWISPHTALIAAESLEPWTFSARAAAMLSAQGHKVSSDVLVMPVSPRLARSAPRDGWSVARGEVRVVRQGKPREDHFLVSLDGERLPLRIRGSAGNYALIRLPEEVPGSPCLSPYAFDGPGTEADLVVLRAGADGAETLAASRPVEQTILGSPVLAVDGAVALRQGQTESVSLRDILKRSDLTTASSPEK